MSKTLRRCFVALLLVLALAGFFAWKNWHDRYVWPAPVASMQELPPEDRSGWPKEPVAWKTETVTVRTATPEGMKPTEVAYHINSIGMKHVRIEPGTFHAGLSDAQMRQLHMSLEHGHQVTLTRPYFIGAFEVRNSDYEKFKPDHARQRPKYQRGRDGDDHPVEPVTWREAQEFCRWLSAKEGRQYRLPTEAEWERAGKAGTETRLYWGDEFWDRNKANLGGEVGNRQQFAEDGFVFTAPVGVYPPNPWGLYDMIGNSWEWCSDWFEVTDGKPSVDPRGPTNGHCRVYKGGGWTIRPRHITGSSRDGDDPADIPDTRGFRVVCELPPS